MRTSSSPRAARGPENASRLAFPGRGDNQNRLPSLREVIFVFSHSMETRLTRQQAIPEIRSTNPGSRDWSDYPRQLHHDPPGPSYYPTPPSLGPSPPKSRSCFPASSGSSSSNRSSNGHQQDGYEPSRIQPERQLPMHSGPPGRSGGSAASISYSDSRSVGSSTIVPRVRSPERSVNMNGTSPGSGTLPPIYTLTQSAAPGIPPQLPPINPNARSPLGSAYSHDMAPQAPHMDPRYSYPSYASRPHDSHAHMGRPVEFQNVEVVEKSSKKRRGNLPRHKTDVLRAWFHDHLDHAYPTEEQKQQLIREAEMSTYCSDMLIIYI